MRCCYGSIWPRQGTTARPGTSRPIATVPPGMVVHKGGSGRVTPGLLPERPNATSQSMWRSSARHGDGLKALATPCSAAAATASVPGLWWPAERAATARRRRRRQPDRSMRPPPTVALRLLIDRSAPGRRKVSARSPARSHRKRVLDRVSRRSASANEPGSGLERDEGAEHVAAQSLDSAAWSPESFRPPAAPQLDQPALRG